MKSPLIFNMTVHELRIKSNRFVENIDSYIESVIDDNQELLDLNREQLKDEHKTTKDQPIRPKYSKGYAALKGFDTPDIYLTGELQKTMIIEATKDRQFYVRPTVEYGFKIIEQYGEEIFGIAKSKLTRAKQITTALLSKIYKQSVFNG